MGTLVLGVESRWARGGGKNSASRETKVTLTRVRWKERQGEIYKSKLKFASRISLVFPLVSLRLEKFIIVPWRSIDRTSRNWIMREVCLKAFPLYSIFLETIERWYTKYFHCDFIIQITQRSITRPYFSSRSRRRNGKEGGGEEEEIPKCSLQMSFPLGWGDLDETFIIRYTPVDYRMPRE